MHYAVINHYLCLLPTKIINTLIATVIICEQHYTKIHKNWIILTAAINVLVHFKMHDCKNQRADINYVSIINMYNSIAENKFIKYSFIKKTN